MKKIKKITAIILALTTLLFSFSLNGFATQETEAENPIFTDVKLFKGRLVLYYSEYDINPDTLYALTHVTDGNEKNCFEGSVWDLFFTSEKVIFEVDNNMFDPFETYRLYVFENEKEICMKEFVPVEISETSLEFIFDYYSFEENEQRDLTDEILIPVNYNGEIRLNAYNTNCYSEPGGSVVSVEGFVVTAHKSGYGDLCLYDENRNETDMVTVQVRERTIDSFKEALDISSTVFWESSSESLGNLGWLAISLGEALIIPFWVLFKVITVPFEVLFG